MNIFNVKVLLGNHQSSRIGVQVVQSVVTAGASHATHILPVVETQAVVISTVCLLERINRVGLHVLWIATFWKTAL